MAETRVEVRETRKDWYWTVRIDPFFEPDNEKRGFVSRVSVGCSEQMDELRGDAWTYVWSKAVVSWYAIGECSPEQAAAFAEALRLAAEAGKRMNAENALKPVRVRQ